MSVLDRLVPVGGVIETDFTLPYPHTVRMKVLTPEACAYANSLLLDPDSGWRKAGPATPTELEK